MIRAADKGLVMQQLLYKDEVRSIDEVEIPDTEVKDAELKLAKQLIDAQTVEAFDPSQYTDEVRARIEKAIEAKVEGQEISMSEAPEQGAQVIDLMEALRASLEKKGAAKAAAPKAAPKAKEPAAADRKPPKRAQAVAEPAPKKVRKG
jgi:DNA end-binding protein Ku